MEATAHMDAVVMMKGWQVVGGERGALFSGSDRTGFWLEVIQAVVRALVVNNNEWGS